MEIKNPVKAIRAKCLDCAYTSPEVALCPCKDCPLYPFRFGKNPYRTKRELTPEHLEKLNAAKERARAAKTSSTIEE